MFHRRLTQALLGIGFTAGCSSQSLTHPSDCPQAPVAATAADQPPPEPSSARPASASSRGTIRDRNGAKLSADPASDTPDSLRPWLGALDDDGEGSSGLEGRFEAKLSQGSDVSVSLDASLHRALEQAFAGVERGAGVVLKVDDGGVLALYSTLPHNTSPGVEQRHWATSWPDACGSTAKPFTALAALRAAVVDTSTKHDCTGGMKVGKLEFRCWDKHGPSDLRRALAISDNIFFFQIARQLKHDDLADAQHAFGLGQGVQLFPSAPSGWVPNREAMVGDGMQLRQATTLNQAIGHGIAVTPLQVARAYAALASGKLSQPSLGRAATTASPIEPGLARFLPAIRLALRHAVSDEEGTAHVPGATPDVAGKTGTAEAAARPGMTNPPHTGWFAGWAPAESPRIAFAFRVQGATGRQVASRVIPAMAAAGRRR